MIYSLFASLKAFPRALLRLVLKACKVDPLTKKETEAFLENYQVANSPVREVFIPGVQNQGELTKLIFPPVRAVTHQSFVWSYEPGTKKAVQLPYGGILTDGKLLCLDFESYHLARNWRGFGKRIGLRYETVIAPFSHYLDVVFFGGYYDFVILVAAKLSRIKAALPEPVFDLAALSYPLFKTTYEQEYLDLIGVKPDHIFDSVVHDIRFDRCILANSGHWFYPDPADIFALKELVEAKLMIKRTNQHRIYVSRSTRRKVVNEAALIKLLEKYDFIIIEDKPRSVAEQVAIYKNASFIMGPHGASFTNIIWCEPGTHLFELFPANMIVDHFAYLAQVMDMRYSAYSHVIKMGQTKHHIEEDVFVSIADLEKSLDVLFVQV
ncbi:glycosyltransferase family 61 protein [Spirosoma radiotolerans]|uniref:glycosyltransferase family 61 protein n=1 Tax=Spirosoma radiotolerans TaxID=1379870 RepID=UPI0006270756|nr:glycosyltransferase family 61 protein [Spirosoma radiotolerans]